MVEELVNKLANKFSVMVSGKNEKFGFENELTLRRHVNYQKGEHLELHTFIQSAVKEFNKRNLEKEAILRIDVNPSEKLNYFAHIGIRKKDTKSQ